MGRKGGKKYRKELRKEQSERDKDALFWKLGKQLSDPLGEYRKFIANLRNKEINEVDDFIDIPINLVDLTANLITSLITGENCLYESINESDKRIKTLNIINEDSETEFETAKITKRNRRKSKSRSRENSNDSLSKEKKLNNLKSNSNLIPLKKNKSNSFNFEEYIQQENEESFYFIRKIIKKTQLSLTTFIVSLYFIYNYKHLEKKKRKHRENKVQKYISDWPSPSSKNTNKKKRRKRKNKNKNSENMTESSSLLTDKGTPSSQENIDMKEEIQYNKNNMEINKGQLPNIEISPHSDTNNNSLFLLNSGTNVITSPILKSGFLSSFQPRRQSSNISICSSIDSKIALDSNSQNTTNSLENQYPSPSHTNSNDDTTNKMENNVNNNEKNTKENNLNNQNKGNTKDNNAINNQKNKQNINENNNEILNYMKEKKEDIYNDNNKEKIIEDKKNK